MSQHDDPVRALVPRSLLEGRHRRREVLLGAAGLGLAALGLGACGSDDDSTAAGGSTTTGKRTLEDEVNLFTWADYDDPQTLKSFTSAQGPKVVVDVYDSNDAMIAKLRLAGKKSGYDIIVPTGPAIPALVKAGLVQKLDKSLLPNLKHIDPAFLGKQWDPQNDYSVIKAWGATGYAYDRKVVGRELVSWDDFFTAAAQKGVSGKVSLLTAPSNITGAVFWREGIDWNTDQKADFDMAEKVLEKELLPHVKSLVDVASQALIEGTVVLAQAWNGDARKAVVEDPERFAWTLPTPKTEVWADNWAIVDGAPHPVAAHAFIDYLMDPKVSAGEIEYIGYNTGVLGSEEHLPKDLVGKEIIYFSDADKARLVEGADNQGDVYALEIANRLQSKLGG